jgi:2'-5' RNA ligase
MQNTLRTFVALTLGAQAKSSLTQLGLRVRDTFEPVSRGKLRPTRPEQLHLTLAFLGDTSRDRLSAVKSCVSAVARRNVSLHLASDQLLLLPKPRVTRVVALGFNDERGILGRLAADLTNSLRALGVALETRAFLPHVTLLRSREPLPLQNEALRQGLTASEIVLKLHEVSYFASVLEPSGARYETLSAASLADPIP